MIFRVRVRIARLLLTAAENLAYLARKVAPRKRRSPGELWPGRYGTKEKGRQGHRGTAAPN
jgi:hypothetical protein